MIVVVELPATLDAVQETSFIHQHDDDDDDDDYDILIYIHPHDDDHRGLE